MSEQIFRPEVVSSFMSAVVRCLRSTIGLDAVIAAVHEPMPAPRIAVALELGGDIAGPVTWVFPPQIALELVRRLLDDPDPPADAAVDGAAELANILTGHATAVLEEYGFHCELGTPKIHTGVLPPGLSVRMKTAQGPIDLVISPT